MVYPILQLVADALVREARAASGRLSFAARLSVGGAVLSVAELSHGGYVGATAVARRYVGQPVRVRQSFSGARVGGGKHAWKMANYLGLVDVFDALYVASRPAQLRIRHHPPSRDSYQPDVAAGRAVCISFARLDFVRNPRRESGRDVAAAVAVRKLSVIAHIDRHDLWRRQCVGVAMCGQAATELFSADN